MNFYALTQKKEVDKSLKNYTKFLLIHQKNIAMPVYFTSLLELDFKFTLSLKSILCLREFFKANM
ncbi:hypothetical protein BOQ00_02720 [Campylobacter coli]|nr:hypothetical protein BOQ00_02720 [Campylobacter coli]